MNVFIYLRTMLLIKLGPVSPVFRLTVIFFGGFMARLQNSASWLKFGGLGVYCYRAT